MQGSVLDVETTRLDRIPVLKTFIVQKEMSKWISRAQGTWRHTGRNKSLECTEENDAGNFPCVLIELNSLKEPISLMVVVSCAKRSFFFLRAIHF